MATTYNCTRSEMQTYGKVLSIEMTGLILHFKRMPPTSGVILYNILCSTVFIQQGSIFPSHFVFMRHHLNICILIPPMYLLVNVLFSVFLYSWYWVEHPVRESLSQCLFFRIDSCKGRYWVTCMNKSCETYVQIVFQKSHVHLYPQKQHVKYDILSWLTE